MGTSAPLRLKLIAAVFAAAWMCCLCAQVASAASAANEHVTVSCEAPRVYIEVNANHFDVYAPGYPDAFVTNVMVRANGSWVLVKPTAAELPLKMSGGDTEPYRVVRPPEDAAGGTISFHNYHIKSNRDGGAKEIVVPAGTSVTYTAYKNGATCPSDWTVNGSSRNNTASIVFNRHWWDVPSWFIPSMDTPQPDVYGVNAHDVQDARLKDSGEMTVVGVKMVSGGGKFSGKDDPGELTAAETIVVKKGGSVALTATPHPSVSWPTGWPTWDASCGFWCFGNHLLGGTSGCETVYVDTSSPDVIVVTASCGESEKCIKVIAYELELSISKTNLTLKHDGDTEFTVVAEPASVFSTPMIQVKRNDIGATRWPNWMDLKDCRGTINWKARVAGIFKLRAAALVAGEECLSDEKDMTVKFPVYDQIIAVLNVSGRMNSEWQATLDDCTQNPNLRRERGFWISLNTAGDGTYSCGESKFGNWSGPFAGASVELGSRPDSTLSAIAPNATSALYAVSSFHTHTPTVYRSSGRRSGPSQSDNDMDQYDNVAGIVYDYAIYYIPPGHPKDSPAAVYKSRNQRSLSAD